MKKLLFLLLFSSVFSWCSSQDIVGTWQGLLVVPGVELHINFNISQGENGYTATLDSPDQNAYGIPVSSVKFEDNKLTITVTDLAIEYIGDLVEKDLIKGTFTQFGNSMDLELTRKKEK